MQKRGKTALTLVGFAVMLAALLALMASIGARKDGFDIDEFFTYGLANSYHQPFLNTETGRWISGKAFSDYLTASGHAHEYLNVYENQIADVHPPLYYLFVHAVCSVFRNPPFTKWTGIALNLFFFSLTQLGLLLLSARLLSDGERLTLTPSALLPGLLYGLSAGAASSVVFIRMYAMMTMWAVWLALALAALWVGGQTVWRMRALAAVLIAGFLTQYYFVVLACMLCGAYFFARLARREFAAAGRFALWCFFALALAVGLFPWCLNHIFGGYRGKGAMESAAALRLIEGDSVLNIMCGKLIRREMIERERLRLVSGLKMAEDALFNLEAALCAREIAYVHRVAYRYRIHSQSATGSRRGGEWETHRPWLIAMRDMLLRRGELEPYYAPLLNSFVLRLYKDGGIGGVMREFNGKAKPELALDGLNRGRMTGYGRAVLALCRKGGYPAVYPLIAVCQMIKRKCGEAAFALRAEGEKPQ